MSSEDTSNNTMPISTETEHTHGGASVVADYQAFRLVYLASSDAEDAECDNETPERMEARVRRVWANYDGDLDAAIALTNQQECLEGSRDVMTYNCDCGNATPEHNYCLECCLKAFGWVRCCGCERTLEGGEECPICSEENLKVY